MKYRKEPVVIDAVRELAEAAQALSKRHQWHPGMGECVCEPHRNISAALARRAARPSKEKKHETETR